MADRLKDVLLDIKTLPPPGSDMEDAELMNAIAEVVMNRGSLKLKEKLSTASIMPLKTSKVHLKLRFLSKIIT